MGQLTEWILEEDKEGGGNREKDIVQNEERKKMRIYKKRGERGGGRCDEHQPGWWEYFILNKHSCRDIFLD